MIFTILRLIIASVFVVSGWVKALDPMGTFYKVGEYLTAFGVEVSDSTVMVLALALCASELFLGVMLFFKLWERVVASLAFLFTVCFTIITAVLLFMPSLGVADCGCFGDAIVLSPFATFAKNIVLLVALFIYVRRAWVKFSDRNNRYYYNASTISFLRKKQLKTLRFFVYLYILCLSLAVPLYSLNYLPPYTYLPFDRGVDLREAQKSNVAEDVFIVCKNTETGEVKEFSSESTEWHNEQLWEYVSTRIEGGGAEKMNFSLYDANGLDVTDAMINEGGYTFLVLFNDLNKFTETQMLNLRTIREMSEAGRVNLSLVSSEQPQKVWEHNFKTRSGEWGGVNILSADNVLIKSLVRDTFGVVMLKDGVVVAKWNDRKAKFTDISYDNLEYVVQWQAGILTRYFIALGVLVAVMLYLIIMFYRTRR